MASGKVTPRQKMIGLMYLVLMAMLALNVSKDILESFVQVNSSLLSSVDNATEKNELLYSSLGMANQLDPERVKPFYEKATSIKAETQVIIDYLEGIKSKVKAATDGLPEEVGDTLQLKNVAAKDNFDIPTEIMIGASEDGSGGLSSEVKTKIEFFKQQLLATIPEKERSDVKIGLELPEGDNGLNWEMNTFYHSTCAATVVNLTKLQNDVKNAEYDMMNRLYAKVNTQELVFDTVAPKVIAPTSYVMMGENYTADIFLAAFNKTKDPKITINGESIPVARGLGQYNFKTNREGMFNYRGEIEMETSSGEIKKYPFESNYIVARPSLTVSPTAMNVMYVGVPNPVSVSVPGVANGNVNVNISQGSLSKTGDGKFVATLPRNAGRTVSVNVTATMPDGSSRSMGKQEFRVKRLPTPKSSVLGATEDGVMARGTLKQMTKLKAVYEDFLFDISATVVSFEMTVYTRTGLLEERSSSEFLTRKMKDILNGLKTGEKVTFSRIKAKGLDGVTRSLGGRTITAR